MYHKESTDDLSAETTSQLFEKETSNVTLIGASCFPTTDRAVLWQGCDHIVH